MGKVYRGVPEWHYNLGTGHKIWGGGGGSATKLENRKSGTFCPPPMTG